jgi:hypothetical protein
MDTDELQQGAYKERYRETCYVGNSEHVLPTCTILLFSREVQEDICMQSSDLVQEQEED